MCCLKPSVSFNFVLCALCTAGFPDSVDQVTLVVAISFISTEQVTHTHTHTHTYTHTHIHTHTHTRTHTHTHTHTHMHAHTHTQRTSVVLGMQTMTPRLSGFELLHLPNLLHHAEQQAAHVLHNRLKDQNMNRACGRNFKFWMRTYIYINNCSE